MGVYSGRGLRISGEKVFQNSEEILRSLRGLKEEVDSGTRGLREKVQGVDNRSVYGRMLEVLESINREISGWIRRIEEVSASEIFIGVIGRYSHGKSSLLNCILGEAGSKKECDILPTGEGIVTAIPTIIKFEESLSEPWFQKGIDGEKLTLEEYRSWVRNPSDASVVEALHIVMPASNAFKKELARQRIVLVDTPGLGGPYWRDVEALKRWMKRFSMVILTLKATDITKSAAKDVMLFLRDFSKPILPVITFWDLWPQSPLYQNCKDADEAFERSLELVVENFPMFDEDDLRHRLCAVSSIIYIKGEKDRDVDWIDEKGNFSNFQRAILDYVRDKKDQLTGRKELSPLMKAKIESIVQSIQLIFDNYYAARKDLFSASRTVEKSGDYFDKVENVLEDFFEKAEELLREASNNIYQRISERAEELKMSLDFEAFNSEVERVFERELERLKQKLSSRFESAVLLKIERILEGELKIDERKVSDYLRSLRKMSAIFDFSEIVPEPLELGFVHKSMGLLDEVFSLIKGEKHRQRERIEKKIKSWKNKHSAAAIRERLFFRWETIKGEIKESVNRQIGDQMDKLERSREEVSEEYHRIISNIDDRLEELRSLLT